MGIRKWLRTTPANVDTTISAAGRRWSNTRRVTNIMQAVPLTITIPAFSINVGTPPFTRIRQFAQINFSLPAPFTFQEYFSVFPENYMVAVRWRVGRVSHRYRIAQGELFITNNDNQYSGQVIGANCVFELYTNLQNHSNPVLTMPSQTLTTSLTDLPSDPNETSIAVPDTSGGLFTDLGVQMPWTMPVTFNPKVTYLTN